MAFLKIKTTKATYYVECTHLIITDDYVDIAYNIPDMLRTFLKFNKILKIDNKNNGINKEYFVNVDDEYEYLEYIRDDNDFLFRH